MKAEPDAEKNAAERTAPHQETVEAVAARRKAARRALLDRLAKQPAMNGGKWTRDEG